MEKIFSFDRFFKYFKYDLINAKSNFGLSALILGFLPLMVFIIGNLFSLIFTGKWAETAGTAFSGMAMGATFIISSIIIGVKLYGSLTDKKAGSNWIMIPASSFEKFLSMFLIVFVIAPVCLAVMLMISDLILKIFPGYTAITSYFNRFTGTMAESGIKVNILAMVWHMWCQYAMAFLLGAIIFKKAKVAKTILWMFIISTVFSIVITKIIGLTNLPEIFIKDMADVTVSTVQSKVNWFLNLCWIGWAVILGGGIFWRLKTIKH